MDKESEERVEESMSTGSGAGGANHPNTLSSEEERVDELQHRLDELRRKKHEDKRPGGAKLPKTSLPAESALVNLIEFGGLDKYALGAVYFAKSVMPSFAAEERRLVGVKFCTNEELKKLFVQRGQDALSEGTVSHTGRTEIRASLKEACGVRPKRKGSYACEFCGEPGIMKKRAHLAKSCPCRPWPEFQENGANDNLAAYFSRICNYDRGDQIYASSSGAVAKKRLDPCYLCCPPVEVNNIRMHILRKHESLVQVHPNGREECVDYVVNLGRTMHLNLELESGISDEARLVLQQYERKILSLNAVSSKPAQGLAHIRLYIVKIFFYTLGKHHPNCWRTISNTGITDLFREFRTCLEEKSKRAKLSTWMFCNYSQCLEDFLEWWSSIIPSQPKILKKNVEVYLTHLKQFGLQHITEAEVSTSCCVPTVGLVKEVVESRFMKWATKEIFPMEEPDAAGPPLMLGIIFIRLLLEVENGRHALLALSIGDFKEAGGSDVVKIAGVTYPVLKVSLLRSSTFPDGTARLLILHDVWKMMHQYCSLVRPARIENHMKKCGVSGIPPSEFFLDERGDSLSSDFISKEFTDAWWLCGGGHLSPRGLMDFICGIIKSGTDHPVIQMYEDVLLQHALEASDNLRKGIDVGQADFAKDKHAKAMERWRSIMKEFYELKEKYLASLKMAPFGQWEDFYKQNRRKRLQRTQHSPPWEFAGQRSDGNADFQTPRQRFRRFLVFEPTVRPSQDNPEGSDPSDDTSNIGTASHADRILDSNEANAAGTPGPHPQISDDEAESEPTGSGRIVEDTSEVGTPSDSMSNTGAISTPSGVGVSGHMSPVSPSSASSDDVASGTVGATEGSSSADDKSAPRLGASSAALHMDTETRSPTRRKSPSSEENASDGTNDDEREAGDSSRSPSPREPSVTLSDIEDDELHEARQIEDCKGVAPVKTEPHQMPVDLVNYTFFGQCRKQGTVMGAEILRGRESPNFAFGIQQVLHHEGGSAVNRRRERVEYKGLSSPLEEV